ncbi:DUF1971 domain-containing protein [Candidatus Microthrix parvicella]|uniref:DUF1971 domain-containing protein n=1 Tax=Candidatus Neomicrothrix parvicella TaxID=41950 RepID=UPI00036CBCA9|nr:DUF1971 domain-containing protein [Candidatus Microthrix parvicella]
MTNLPTLPDGLELARTTKVFDNETAPTGLLKAHQVAEAVWGRLVVHTGSVGFVFEDMPDDTILVGAGDHVVIPPQRHHHVVLGEPATFVVEFYKAPAGDVVDASRPTTTLSMGLLGSSGSVDPDPA